MAKRFEADRDRAFADLVTEGMPMFLMLRAAWQQRERRTRTEKEPTPEAREA